MAELKQYAAEPMAEVPEMKELIDKKMKEMAELKPCDCGCVDIMICNAYPGYFCECCKCETRTNIFKTRKQAIDAWNKRS